MINLKKALLDEARPDSLDQQLERLDVLFEKRALTLKRRTRIVDGVWIVLICTCVFLLISGGNDPSVANNWKGILACFWLVMGGIFLNQKWHAQSRLDTRRELARLETILWSRYER